MSTLTWPLLDDDDSNTAVLTLQRTDVPDCDIEHEIVNRKPLYHANPKTYRATLRRDGLRDRDVICKMVVGKKNVLRLRNEAKFYRNELKELQGDIIPICFGLFEVEPEDDDITACLIVSYCGDALDIPLFGKSWEFKDKVIGLLITIHEAGVEHGDFDERHIVVDKEGEPWIIDFDNARPHTCDQKMAIEFHSQELDMDDFGCREIWETCASMGVWTPRKIRFMGAYLPVECASSVEELAAYGYNYLPKDRALEEAVYALQKHEKYLYARAHCDWKNA